MNKLIVKKAAVLGAGVMGAQIAAHLANANVPVVLFDCRRRRRQKRCRQKASTASELTGTVANQGNCSSSPPPLRRHLPLLAECDW